MDPRLTKALLESETGCLLSIFLCAILNPYKVMQMATTSANTPKHDLVFDLDAPAFSSDEFRMFEFKVKRCPRVLPHDWACCPFSHVNEKAKRRDPRYCKYGGTACPEFRRNGCCRRADSCPFAHGIFECWMHPSRYRTQMCSEVLECKRRVCFFAHTESELRRPVDDATWMANHSANMAAYLEQESTSPQGVDMELFLKKQSVSAAYDNQPTQGLIPAIHGPPSNINTASPPSQNNNNNTNAVPDVMPILQQLATNGQLDASQLLQLVAAVTGGATKVGGQTTTPSAGSAAANGSMDSDSPNDGPAAMSQAGVSNPGGTDLAAVNSADDVQEVPCAVQQDAAAASAAGNPQQGVGKTKSVEDILPASLTDDVEPADDPAQDLLALVQQMDL